MAIDTLQIREVGKVKEIKKSIAKVVGLSRCINGQPLDITANAGGMVIGFSGGEAAVLLLGKTEEVSVGTKVFSRMEPFTIPVGEEFIGRIVDATARPLDGKGPIPADEHYPVFGDAPGVLDRVPITEALETGILSIDTTIPIGRGQRELIIGDRMTGKTSICTDTILNQKGKDVICIYCSIGRSYSSLKRIVETLKAEGALDYTIVVAATASCSSAEQYLVPYTACALGEYFMNNGLHVFVAFDDLTKHAWAYRQISLLLERSPGRDAYPGDIFYLHSQLMERAGKLNPELGGGSMTFFPLVDTLQGDVTGYIPSNLISMTDGQIYLDTALFSSGFKPAVNLGLSVSRIGNKVQCPAMKQMSEMLRLEYLQYNELVKVTKFKAGISDDVTARLKHGQIITQLFVQDRNEPHPLEGEIILLYALKNKVLESMDKDGIEDFKRNILGFAKREFPEVVKGLSETKELSPGIKEGLDRCLGRFLG